jgi:2,3-bisphosphoglycerate-independent phosphoglycerate mutase
MTSAELAQKYGLVRNSGEKLLLVVLDGLGGMSHPITGLTELETAYTPTMDLLAAQGACGLIDPIKRGLVPGSGLAHLSLFGYDTFKYPIGRGSIAAYGIGFDMQDSDVAVRVNFCTAAEDGTITDRRAGRIPTDTCRALCERLDTITLSGNIDVFVKPVREHRAVVIFRGSGLTAEAKDTDPGAVGSKPLPLWDDAGGSRPPIVQAAEEFQNKAWQILKEQNPANAVVMRGFATKPKLPSMNNCYGLNAACIAVYPDYKGICRMVGMEIVDVKGETIADEFKTLAAVWKDHDFVFLHVKKTDSYGEDGDFDAKVGVIEDADRVLAQAMDLSPDVMVVTGDHSTPAQMASHSAHPVPILYWGQWVRPDLVEHFGETECGVGSLGRFDGSAMMLEALAYTGRLDKFGA